jgi:CelD/BcsL family acetyltransferase involved in cellulose biosynthesis
MGIQRPFTAGSSVRVTLVKPADLGDPELARWRQMQHADPTLANPFLSPEFTLAVGRAREAVRVGVVEDGSGIVAFFPHERRGPFVATAVGAGISDCQALVHAPGFEWDAKELVRGCGLPVFEFDHMIAGQDGFARYHSLRIASPAMDLSGGFAAYVDDRLRVTKGIIRDTQRKMRKLERELGPLKYEYEVTDAESLDLLMGWKSAQYRRTRVPDRFATPWIVQVVTDLLATRTDGCTGTLSVLRAGDQPVAAHFGIRSGSVLSYWFPAYDPEFGRYSPGVGLLLRMAESAAEHGADHVDLGRGQTRYKDELKNRELLIAEGRVGVSWPATAVQRTRGALDTGVRRIRRRRPLRHVRRLVAAVRGAR